MGTDRPGGIGAALARPLQPLRHRWLLLRHGRRLRLEPRRFEGRRVLLLGPARTLDADLAALGGTGWDVVVRMNNGLGLPVAGLEPSPWRCDVLFHSLTADARSVTPEALARGGVECLVHRTTGVGRLPRTLEAERRLAPVAVRVVPPARYRQLARRLGGASPTTGLVALDVLLRTGPATLGVAGLTFFATRYAPGYDDRDRADPDSLARVRAAGHHDPEAERRLLRGALGAARADGLDLRLGPAVAAALA